MSIFVQISVHPRIVLSVTSTFGKGQEGSKTAVYTIYALVFLFGNRRRPYNINSDLFLCVIFFCNVIDMLELNELKTPNTLTTKMTLRPNDVASHFENFSKFRSLHLKFPPQTPVDLHHIPANCNR